jgi:hypothetical protein
MKATLIVAFLTFLRLGIPAIVLLSLGEVLRRAQNNRRKAV